MENPNDSSELLDGKQGPARKRFKQFVINHHSGATLECLQALRSEQQLCDVKLVVDGHTMSDHKVVLAATSPYFRAMFRGEYSMSTGHGRVYQTS